MPTVPSATSVRPLPPRPSERVADHHRDFHAEPGAHTPSRMRHADRSLSMGSGSGVPLLHVGKIDTGVSAHETVTWSR